MGEQNVILIMEYCGEQNKRSKFIYKQGGKMKGKRILGVLLCVALLFGMAGCKADISEYENEEIQIIGLLDEDFTVTPGELAEMECTEATAHGKTAKAGTVQAYGPTLETFLSAYGKSLDEFYSIKFYAKDDYTVTLGRQTFQECDVILSIAMGSEPLYEGQRPLRLVIPEADSGKWTYMVYKIEFTYAE